MEDIATERTGVAFASIYDATDGALFNGEPNGNEWLVQNGFDGFQFGTNTIDLINGPLGGNLLDNMALHPLEENSGAFFAAILGNIIREAGCPADIVNDGYININDLIAVVNGWEQQGETDINGDGVTNVTDIILLINSWGECWPVQAPFNTPAFRSMKSGRIPYCPSKIARFSCRFSYKCRS